MTLLISEINFISVPNIVKSKCGYGEDFGYRMSRGNGIGIVKEYGSSDGDGFGDGNVFSKNDYDCIEHNTNFVYN